MKFAARLESNRLPQLSAALQARAEQIVIKTAFDIEEEAKRIVPVDTGKLKNSIGNVSKSPLQRTVYAATEYAEAVEFGTAKQAAQPYMTPAAEALRPAWNAAWRQLLP